MKRQWSYWGLGRRTPKAIRSPKCLNWVLALVVFASGCGPDIAAFCEAREGCIAGNDADIDACEASYHGLRDNAYDIGCGEEYDLLFECYAPQYECIGSTPCSTIDDCIGGFCVDGECKNYGMDGSTADACEEEDNALSRCY
jgi:hypothetical protein